LHPCSRGQVPRRKSPALRCPTRWISWNFCCYIRGINAVTMFNLNSEMFLLAGLKRYLLTRRIRDPEYDIRELRLRLWGSAWLLDSNFDTHFSGSHDASLTLSEGYVEANRLSPRYRCRGHDRQLAVAASPFVRTRQRQVARPCDCSVKCYDGRSVLGSRTVHTDSTVDSPALPLP
jgi:hypothetical protein